MNRRDFFLLSTRGSKRVLDLSCERLYMRYVDARSPAGRREEQGQVDADVDADIDADPQSWEGEPPTEIEKQTAGELFEELERELSNADVLRVLDRDWLAGGEFRLEVEARVEAFRRRGGRVEYGDSASGDSASGDSASRSTSAGRTKASSGHLAVAICFGVAAALGAHGSLEAQSASDVALQQRVEVALASASDVPADSITVEVRNGVVTLIGSVVCDDCGGRRTPGGFGTVQQSLGAVVRAIPGVERVEFRLEYAPRAGPPGGAGR